MRELRSVPTPEDTMAHAERPPDDATFMPTCEDLLDRPLLEEIQLLAELMVAASACTGPMDPQQIDGLLGVPGTARRTTPGRGRWSVHHATPHCQGGSGTAQGRGLAG
ncbi:MAG: hypothetical protein ACR2MP_20320 [Streptosporangiaceae bacterium]